MPRKTRKSSIYNSVLRRESSNVWVRNKMKGIDALADWKPIHSGGGSIVRGFYLWQGVGCAITGWKGYNMSR